MLMPRCIVLGKSPTSCVRVDYLFVCYGTNLRESKGHLWWIVNDEIRFVILLVGPLDPLYIFSGIHLQVSSLYTVMEKTLMRYSRSEGHMHRFDAESRICPYFVKKNLDLILVGYNCILWNPLPNLDVACTPR
jgi:hypothetical protein